MKKYGVFLIILIALCQGCTAGHHRSAVANDNADKITVGTVQKEIRVGMSGAEVVEALGSPNIVSTDELRREVWVYDKMATDHAYSSSSGGVSLLVIGFGASSGASSTSQRTLTIIIKFDEEKKVRDFAYRQSSF